MLIRFSNADLPPGNVDFSTLSLNPYLNIRSAGNDGELYFAHVLSQNFTCPTPYADVRVDAYPMAGSPAQLQITPISNSDLQYIDGELTEVSKVGPGTYALGYHEPGYDTIQTVWLPEVGRPIFQSKSSEGALITTANRLNYTGGPEKESVSARTVPVDSGILARIVINEDILPSNFYKNPSDTSTTRFRFYLRDASYTGASFVNGTYGFEIAPEQLFVVYNSGLEQVQTSIDDNQYSFSGYTYDVIIRDGIFRLLKNGSEVYKNIVDPSVLEYKLVVEAFNINYQLESDVDIFLSQPTTPEPTLEQYVALKQEFDGSVVRADDDVFRFYVRERYKVTEAPLQIDLVDPDGYSYQTSTSTNHRYGDNFHELALGLHRNGVYYMEVTSPNKGTVYKQLFYWECPSSSPCTPSY